MTLPLWFLGVLILAAIIALVAIAHGGPEPIEDPERERKRQILESCAARKNRRVERPDSLLSPAVHDRLRHSMIDYPDDEGDQP